MPVPKRKRSRARRDSRFAHKGMVMHAIAACKNCDTPLLPHAACHKCGFYKGAKVMKTKVDRNMRRVKAKQVKAATKSKKRPAQSEPAE